MRRSGAVPARTLPACGVLCRGGGSQLLWPAVLETRRVGPSRASSTLGGEDSQRGANMASPCRRPVGPASARPHLSVSSGGAFSIFRLPARKAYYGRIRIQPDPI